MRFETLFYVLAITVSSHCSTGIGQDATELESLRKEVAALRAELATVREERDGLKSQLKKLQSSSGERKESLAGALNGIQWEITALNSGGVAVHSTTFYAQDGKVMKDGKEIGNYTDAGNRARMDVTNAPAAKGNGTYNLLRVKNDPPTYSGIFKNKEGVEVRILLRAILD